MEHKADPKQITLSVKSQEKTEYILLDLEWNSAYSKRSERFINEIIEFGAVRLNGKLEEIDSFQAIVRSQLTKRLSGRTKELTNISNEEMASGDTFKSALARYTKWAGKNAITMTWSNTDLYVLLDNCRSFTGHKRIPCIGLYADLQQYIQDTLIKQGSKFAGQISLAHAAQEMEIDTASFDLHRARDDSRVCCALLRIAAGKACDTNQLFSYLEDTDTEDYYDRLTYKAYMLSDLHNPLIDRNQMRFRCEECGRFAKRKERFSFKNRFFKASFHCNNCGNDFVGRISFKKTYDSVVIKKAVAQIPVQILEDGETESDGTMG